MNDFGLGGVQNETPKDSKVTPEAVTLKLVQNKTHVGPVSVGRKAKADLSAAAGKIKLNNNFKLELVDAKPDAKAKPSGNEVEAINLTPGSEAEDAFYYMLSWDRVFGDKLGSPAYIKKAAELERARSKFYSELGFSPNPKERPELTEVQRRDYDAKIRPFAFSYYEYRLSFKQPGVKAVRSKTYRTLEARDMSKIASNLLSHVDKLKASLVIKASKN